MYAGLFLTIMRQACLILMRQPAVTSLRFGLSNIISPFHSNQPAIHVVQSDLHAGEVHLQRSDISLNGSDAGDYLV
jgi:hypothetical protein